VLDELRQRDLSAAWTLLRTAAAAARRSGWPAALADLLAEAPPVTRARDAVHALLEAMDGLGGAEAAVRARAQLAALVEPLRSGGGTASLNRARSERSPSTAATPSVTPAAWSRPAAIAVTTGATRGGVTIRRVAVAGAGFAVAVAGTIVGAGHLAHREPPAAIGRSAHHAPAPTTTTAASPTLAPLPTLPLLAPSSAGDVTAVSILPLSGSCTPGATCTVTVRVDLAAHPQEMVGWVLEVIDRCTSRRTETEVHPMEAPSSFVFVYSPATVLLPATSASAIIALTTAPAHAASLPLLIPAAATSCLG
jgi:hypothetical protein